MSGCMEREGIKETGSARKSSSFKWRCLDVWGSVSTGKTKTFGQLLEGTVEWPWQILGGKVSWASGTVSERP